jgi:hypothetical protein
MDDRRIAKRLDAAIAIAMAALTLCLAAPAHAFDARFHRQPKDLPPGLANALTEKVSDEALPYLDKEDEKHKNGERYTDLQQKFEYLPNYGPGGKVVCSVKLGGAEYDPVKGESSGKGKATGRLKYLVFTYALQNKQWVEMNKPKWESQDLGPEAARKMTASAERAEKRKASVEAARKQAALKKAAEQAQKQIDVPPQTGNDHP